MNEKFEAIDNRTNDFFESLNLSFLKTSENMKNELSRRNVNDKNENATRSIIEKIDFCFIVLNDLFLNLFNTKSLLSIKLSSMINKKLK